MMRWIALAGLLALGCPPTVEPDKRASPIVENADTGEVVHTQTHAVIATVADDFSVGALATVGLDDWRVDDTLAPISGDPAVAVDDGLVVQLNRYNYDTVRVYAPGEWTTPRIEFALADGANPHDAEVCGGALWISQYGSAQLPAYDTTSGLLIGAVDLAAFADADGLPETSDLVEIDGVIYAALHRLDRDAGWTGDAGAIVAIDCATRAIVDSWETGISPSISALGHDRLLVRTGLYGSLDGAVRILDPADGAPSQAILTEEDHGEDITAVLAHGDTAIVLSADDNWRYTIGCLDLQTGAYAAAETTPAYLLSAAVNERGEAWIAARAGWADPPVEGGIIVYDIPACASLVRADWIPTLLAPFSIGFYP
jgi:hypothetical protein